MPGILNALSRDEALALTEIAGAPTAQSRAEGIASLARAAARRQQRSRRTWVAGAVASAAALLAVGAVAGSTGFMRSPPPVQTVALQAMAPTPREGVTARLAVTGKKWGTQLNWACHYTLDWSRTVKSYDIVVTTHDGAQQVVGTWSPAGDEATGLSAATSIATSQVRTVDIRVSGTSEPLAITTLN